MKLSSIVLMSLASVHAKPSRFMPLASQQTQTQQQQYPYFGRPSMGRRPYPGPFNYPKPKKNLTETEKFEACRISTGQWDTVIPAADKNTTQDQVRVIFILDKTGSMWGNRQATIESYNEFIQSQRRDVSASKGKMTSEDDYVYDYGTTEEETDSLTEPVAPETKEGKAPRYTLVKFATELDIETEKSIVNSKDLTEETYYPTGSTALLDAMGCTMKAYEKEMFNILVVLTDGEENSSNIYDSDDVKVLTKKMQDEQNWEIQYLGANQDAFDVANSLGVHARAGYNAVGYSADSMGFKTAMKQASTYSTNQRSRQYSKMMAYKPSKN